MDSKQKKSILEHIKTLEDYQEYLFNIGHNYWACDMEDKERKMPFYFYQRNRSKLMVTCGTCYKLMEIKRKIRTLQKEIGAEQNPLITNYKEREHVKRMHVTNSSMWNPNAQYI